MSKFVATQYFRDKNNTSNEFNAGDPIGNKLSAERIEELTRLGYVKEVTPAKKPAVKPAPSKAKAKPAPVVEPATDTKPADKK